MTIFYIESRSENTKIIIMIIECNLYTTIYIKNKFDYDNISDLNTTEISATRNNHIDNYESNPNMPNTD
jgi:hypothetical protein